METNQDYEDFISTISHELRTPLTSIKGFSQTMLASWDRLDDASKKKFIKIIEEQSQRLINLVENMLTVTKMRKKDILRFNEFDIKPVIDQTIMILKTQYSSQKFVCNYVNNIPKLFADKDKFQQIMTNLLENSAKYSLEDKVTNIEISAKDNDIYIEISNKGLKISQDDYEKIFTKFSRIDNPLTRKVQGSGLGLYITKNLTEKIGGNISVKSESIPNSKLDKITFTLVFPVKNQEEQIKIKCKQ